MSVNLSVPIYVDTNSLLDLLASIEGGFSTVEKISTQSTSSKSFEGDVKVNAGTEFGIPNVLNLLKLTVGFGASKGVSSGESVTNEIVKYHTYGSLFHRLREYLESESLIKKISAENEGWEAINPSDFVEIRGIFRPNPLTDSLGIVNRLIGIADLLSTNRDITIRKPKGKLSAEQRREIEEQKTKAEAAKAQTAQMEQIRKFLTGIIDDVEEENIRAFVIDSDDDQGYTAVALLFIDYLRDKTMTEISHKEYHVLGKVVRKLEPDSSESIDLLLGTALGGIGESQIDQILDALSNSPGMNFPEVKTKITGPALEIVPIAVFV